MFTSIQHVNLCVGVIGTEEENIAALEKATYFFHNIIGLGIDKVPEGRSSSLAWFRIGSHGQQIHCAFQKKDYVAESTSEAHPCFTVPLDQMEVLRAKLVEFSNSGHPAACETPDGGDPKTNVGLTHIQRFFFRDFAGNRIEITAEV